MPSPSNKKRMDAGGKKKEKKQQEKLYLISPVHLLKEIWTCSSHFSGTDIVSQWPEQAWHQEETIE